jgi:hypothetical protein
VTDQPVITSAHKDISVAAVMVEANLGEDREVAGDSCLVRAYFGEADVGDVVADDSLHPRRLCRCVWCCDGSAEKLDDRCPTADRVAAAQLEFAVLAKGLSKVVESQGVTRQL